MRLRNKKLACFIGMAHHSRFLLPIMDRARSEGAEVLLFTTVTDYPFERDLLNKGYQFRFLTEYADQSTRTKTVRATKILLDEWMNICFSWDGFRHWSLFEQHRSLTRNIEEYFCLEQMIIRERPDMFCALHEMNPWGKQVGHLSMKYGIPYVTLQEGEYYADLLAFTCHTEYSTANLLWGETTRDMLVKWRSSPDKIVIIGNTHIDEALKAYAAPERVGAIKKELGIETDKKVVSFLIDAEWGAVDNREPWNALLEGLNRPDLACVLKWHPNVLYSAYQAIEAMIKEVAPHAVMLYTYDPYKVLAIADYCVVLGKTTLGIEAIAFGKPLFAIPTLHERTDHYVALGVAQSVFPLGNWEHLFRTMEHGVPDSIRSTIDEYLRRSFYKLDGRAVDRALEVMSYILNVKGRMQKAKRTTHDAQRTTHYASGRVSFVIPSGSDQEALLSTLTSLSQNVKFDDWEVIIVLHNKDIGEMLSDISGDVVIVEAREGMLSALYNKGAAAAKGEYLIFMKPGMVYFRDEGFLEAMGNGVAGMPISNPDMTQYCHGIGFDFNSAPYCINEQGKAGKIEAVGGGLVGMSRKIFEAIGGFDEGMADHLIEPDVCLSVKEKGYSVTYLPECLAVVYKKTLGAQSSVLSPQQSSEDEWKGRIRFFAKWCGKLPKDDDYLTFAGDLLKV
ncbi:MAG: glycosyltransferase family 2 protein [Nitrospirota bacterium]